MRLAPLVREGRRRGWIHQFMPPIPTGTKGDESHPLYWLKSDRHYGLRFYDGSVRDNFYGARQLEEAVAECIRINEEGTFRVELVYRLASEARVLWHHAIQPQ